MMMRLEREMKMNGVRTAKVVVVVERKQSHCQRHTAHAPATGVPQELESHLENPSKG